MGKKYMGRFQSYCRCLADLSTAKTRDPSDSFVLSGTVSKFCLTFDLAWKVMKDIILEDYGITDFATGSPRDTLRTAASVGLISDDEWLKMLRLRNNLIHDYDYKIAASSFPIILQRYLPLLEQFAQKVKEHLIRIENE